MDTIYLFVDSNIVSIGALSRPIQGFEAIPRSNREMSFRIPMKKVACKNSFSVGTFRFVGEFIKAQTGYWDPVTFCNESRADSMIGRIMIEPITSHTIAYGETGLAIVLERRIF